MKVLIGGDFFPNGRVSAIINEDRLKDKYRTLLKKTEHIYSASLTPYIKCRL